MLHLPRTSMPISPQALCIRPPPPLKEPCHGMERTDLKGQMTWSQTSMHIFKDSLYHHHTSLGPAGRGGGRREL